jgi:hypothetical protein
MAKSDVRNLLQLAKTGVPYLLKLARDPDVWKQMFERDFPGDFAFFGGSVPILFRGYQYLLFDRDYKFSKYMYDNDWKRYYLWMRYFYKGFFKDNKYFETSYGVSKKIEELTFKDSTIQNFIEMLIQSIVYTFLKVPIDEETDIFQRPVDLLIKYMMDLDDNRLTVKFLKTGKRNRQEQLTELDDPLILYRGMIESEKKQLRYYNPLFDALIMCYNSDEYTISKLNLIQYEDVWRKRVSSDPYAIGFFKRVSRIWNWRCSLLICVGATQSKYTLILLLLFGDQGILKNYLDDIRNSELFLKQHRTWMNIADNVHRNEEFANISFFSQMFTFLEGKLLRNNVNLKHVTNVTFYLSLKAFLFSPSIKNEDTGDDQLILQKI